MNKFNVIKQTEKTTIGTRSFASAKVCRCGNEHFRDTNLCVYCEEAELELRHELITAYLKLESNVEAARRYLGQRLLNTLARKLTEERK